MKRFDGSAIEVTNHILHRAFDDRASDVHIEPDPDGFRIRVRVDGQMRTVGRLDRASGMDVISRLKMLSNLRSDEQRRPQDGSFAFKDKRVDSDIRISVMPTYHGHNTVLRLLMRPKVKTSLSDLGMTQIQKETIEKTLDKEQGLILITGPTGSGKTTTAYTCLENINRDDNSIITLEDPVEYALPGISQVHVKDDGQITFFSGLRTILRQDPDIIMVGEIRDPETAELTLRSSLTGHSIIATLHTPDCITALTRLLDMGLEPYLIASIPKLTITNQRLVKKLCCNCAQLEKLTDIEKEVFKSIFGIEPAQTDYPKHKGCKRCDFTGYKSRVGIFEILQIDDQIRQAIVRKASKSEIQRLAQKSGFKNLKRAGLKALNSRVTTLDEIIKIF